MPRQSNTDRLSAVHARAMRRFDNIQSAVRDVRIQCLEDRRFASIAGAQWEGALSEQFDNRPKFEVNKIQLSLTRIFNEYRNNRITVDFVSRAGMDDDDLADACDGLYRADEQDSSADEAYDNAFDEGTSGGFGSWRLRACYEDEADPENDQQRIRIEPIYDADSCVFFDLNARRQDKSDATHAFVLYGLSVDDYGQQYVDRPTSMPRDIQNTEYDWFATDTIYTAEYYEIEEHPVVWVIFERIDGEEERYREDELDAPVADAAPTLREMLAGTGAKEKRSRKTIAKRVHKYVIDGAGVIEDCGYIAGCNIPIVPVYGKRWFIDGIERCAGHVRYAKDAQRLKNMQLSRLAETAALSPIEKPIFVPEQIAGHEWMWANDSVERYPYLLINPLSDMQGNEQIAGPVGTTSPPEIAPALAALLAQTEDDIRDILGRQESGEQLQPNLSGKAVELIQTRLDMQSFIFLDNMAKAMRRSGEIWLGMARELLVERGRKMRTIDRHEEPGSIELMQPVIDERTGERRIKNDLSDAQLQVTVDVGPSSTSARAATVRALTGMLQMTDDPQTKQVLTATALMNMDGEGLGDLRDYFRTQMIKAGVIRPTEQEASDLLAAAQNAPPDPQSEYLRAAAEQAQAEAAQARADTVETVARAGKTDAQTQEIRAKTVETIAKIDIEQQRQAAQLVAQLAQLFQAAQ